MKSEKGKEKGVSLSFYSGKSTLILKLSNTAYASISKEIFSKERK